MSLVSALVATTIVFASPLLPVDPSVGNSEFVEKLSTVDSPTALLVSVDVEWNSGDEVAVKVEAPPEKRPAEDKVLVEEERWSDLIEFDVAGDDLVGIVNGAMPASLLQTLSFAPHAKAYIGAAQRLEAMNKAYREDTGTDLGVSNAYRPGFQGRSFHGWGIAVDFLGPSGAVLNWDDTQFRWLMDNASHFGFYLPMWAAENGTNPEPWHWEVGSYYRGDASDCASRCPQDRQFWIKY